MATPLTQRIAEEHAATAGLLSPDVLASRHRRQAMATLAASGLPVSRDENWKYANLRPLERARFAPVAAPPAAAVSADRLPTPIETYTRYTFVDGAFAPQLSSALREHAGVSVRTLSESAQRSEPSQDPDARFALLNEAFATDGAWIGSAAGADCPACVELIFIATADATSGASYPRVELHAGPRSRLGVIERHISLGSESSFVNAAVKVEVAASARVDHYRVQQMGTQATWIDTLEARLAEHAEYQLHLINLGAASARSTVRIELKGERSTFDFHCASVADRQQVHDVYALIDHLASDSVSRQSFRGIAANRARVACNSKVVVREGARGADSYQSLRGLLAGADAEIDVRPQLEIYTDDVRCAHGATAGKLDEGMLFYLLSRGIDRDTALLLLKWAFLEDVVSRVAVPELRRQIEQTVAGRMSDTAALAELL